VTRVMPSWASMAWMAISMTMLMRATRAMRALDGLASCISGLAVSVDADGACHRSAGREYI